MSIISGKLSKQIHLFLYRHVLIYRNGMEYKAKWIGQRDYLKTSDGTHPENTAFNAVENTAIAKVLIPCITGTVFG